MLTNADGVRKTFQIFISVFIIFAIKYAGHVITTSVRALEIVIIMLIELFAFNIVPIMLSWIGSTLVFVGVLGIAFCDSIIAFVQSRRKVVPDV